MVYYFVQYGMNKVDLSRLCHITTAGEALNPEVFRQVEEQTGLKLKEGFGQTGSVLMLANYVGRVDGLIKTRGFRVGPFEVENVLMEHPAVWSCGRQISNFPKNLC